MRVAVRHPGRVPSRLAAGKAGQVSAIYADVWDEPSVGPALEGSDAVINTVGHYVERGKATFEAIHGHGAMHVARAAALAGVERLVHISGIGADAASASTYVRARAIGERLVREQFPRSHDPPPERPVRAGRRVPQPAGGHGAGDAGLAAVRQRPNEAAAGLCGRRRRSGRKGPDRAFGEGPSLRARRAPDLHLQGAGAAGAHADRSQAAAPAGSVLRMGAAGDLAGPLAEAPNLARPGHPDEAGQRCRSTGGNLRRPRHRADLNRGDLAYLSRTTPRRSRVPEQPLCWAIRSDQMPRRHRRTCALPLATPYQRSVRRDAEDRRQPLCPRTAGER